MKVLVTGAAGFVGSHAVEHYSRQGAQVTGYDNLSRGALLQKPVHRKLNWEYLEKLPGVSLVEGDIRDLDKLRSVARDTSAIIHTAAQTAVTTSMVDPATDFGVNAQGTFTVLEAARLSPHKPAVVFCSTNKVYGNNVNQIPLKEGQSRYDFVGDYGNGVPEAMSVDRCEHTPYGCSKLAADLYVQDYSHVYGLKTGVFRMSCIYGTRQFGVEDQGWVCWLALSTLLGRPITIYGDGKQVRDVLFVSDLVRAFDLFVKADVRHGVFNMGGGPQYTLSLLELLDLLQQITGKRSQVSFADWRPADQKVYVSDISRARDVLKWRPEVSPRVGVERMVMWLNENLRLFE